MEQHIESKLDAMAKAQEQLARIMDSERRMVLHLAEITGEIPHDAQPLIGSHAEFPRSAGKFTKQISAYLHALAALEDALADNLSLVIKELRTADEE